MFTKRKPTPKPVEPDVHTNLAVLIAATAAARNDLTLPFGKRSPR